MEPTEEHIYNNDSNESRIQIPYKDPNHTESQIRLSTDKIQMGLRVLKINDGVHNPAHAKPKG